MITRRRRRRRTFVAIRAPFRVQKQTVEGKARQVRASRKVFLTGGCKSYWTRYDWHECPIHTADATQLSSCVASASAVWTQFAIAHNECRRIRSIIWKLNIAVWLREYWSVLKTFSAMTSLRRHLSPTSTGNCKLGPVMLTRTWGSRPRPRPRTGDIKIKFFTCLLASFFTVKVLWVFLCSYTINCILSIYE